MSQLGRKLLSEISSGNDYFQYKHDLFHIAVEIRLGSGSRHSQVSYISIN